MTLSTFQTIEGVDLAMSNFGSIGYMTLEPGSRDREEQISFSGVTQNANGTATLTGIKNVLFVSPYTQTSGFAKSHPGGVVAVLTNTSGFYNEFPAKENNETITGFWQAPDPLATQGIATKGYVDNLVNGGTVTTNALIEVGLAGETITTGQVVYLKASDGRWWKATGSTAATVNVIQLGIAQGAGTAGVNITGGVLRRGIDSNQSGGAAGSIGYVSNTSTVSTSAGTTERAIGNFLSATSFDFDPSFYYTPTANIKAATAGLSGTAVSATNPLIDATAMTGDIFPYGLATAPTGWLLCNGAAVSRSTYATLFGIIGTTYGAGDTTTTFNLPFIPKTTTTGSLQQAIFDSYSRPAGVGSGTTLSFSHTTTGTNRFLVISLLTAGSSPTATYNGVAMTLRDSQSGGGGLVAQFYLANPALGTNTVAISWTGSGAAQAQAVSFCNIKQTSPADSTSKANATSATISATLTTTANNDLLILSENAVSSAVVSGSNGWSKIPTLSSSAQIDTFFFNGDLPTGLNGGFFNLSASVDRTYVMGAYFVVDPAVATSYQIIKT